MMFNVKLFAALKEKGLNQRKFADLVGDDSTKVSRVINGVWNLDESSKAKYAKALGLRVSDIFSEEE